LAGTYYISNSQPQVSELEVNYCLAIVCRPYKLFRMAPTAVSQPPRPPKPSKTRYFKGKGPELRDSDSESDEDDSRPEPVIHKRKDENYVAGGAGRLITNKDVRQGLGKDGGVKMSLADVQIGGPKREESEEESEEEDEEEDEKVDIKPGYIPKPPGDEVRLRSKGIADVSRASTRRTQKKSQKRRKSQLSGLFS
jgi:hypothetical protein